ncbi:hypothetical protein [uncultured Devosia sp.]|uniref:hypothetical protein n=1 Tax=uncultured Devosia sp. TaxID=211434 RepID=UPI00262B3D2E|nr:hypothetical protein [uncultured Devosia sp.]
MLYKRLIAAVMVSAVLMPSLASAGGLLDGVLGGDDAGGSSVLGIVGDGDSGALVTLNSGNAGDSGLVNVGLGGSDGVVTANVGGGSAPIVDASVLGPQGIADVNANLGGLDTNVNVGGPGSLVDIDIGGGSSGGGNGGNGGSGGSGGNGGNGGNGSNGSGGSTGGGTVIIRSGGSTSAPASAGITAMCADANPSQLMALFQKSSTRGWNRASGIQLIPIKVCADLRRQMANWLAANGEYHRLLGAVAQDPLINAALSRTQYRPGHVLGVHKQGTTLMVYVF